MNDIMTDGEWSYLRQSAVDRMANGTETANIEMTMLVDLVAQVDALRRSRAELITSLAGLTAFKESVDAALNSGDGSYKP
jgi:hypothetical protein